MKIVADSAIPFLRHFFSSLGEIIAVDGHTIGPDTLRDADALLVRTTTRVNAALLAGSRVRFVGSPTSGIDHLDTAYLDQAGIPWAAAPGCNARSVAEYVLSALLVLTETQGRRLRGMRAGIIGCGHAGSWVARLLTAAGVDCILHDPPLQAATSDRRFQPLAAALDADVVTLHVPLTGTGPHPTAGMVDAAFLAALPPDAIFVNCARGEVVDEAALVQALRTRPALRAVIDVWNHEPDVNADLLREADIATPHIAGYSTDGRLRAVAAVAGKLCRHVSGREPDVGLPPLPEPGNPELRLEPDLDLQSGVRMAVLGSYDVRSDAGVLRALAQSNSGSLRRGFLEARNNYPLRREFPARRIIVPPGRAAIREALEGLGFSVQQGT